MYVTNCITDGFTNIINAICIILQWADLEMDILGGLGQKNIQGGLRCEYTGWI